jgi:regulator of sigma E protease
MILQNIPIGLIGLSLMVFIHELGHFLAARAMGIEVEAFALGWGPTIWRRKGKRTEYRLAAFPIGGYCKMKGAQDMADALQNKTDHMNPSPGSFFAATPWRRMVVSLAGPLFNLLFAVICLTLIWWAGYSYASPDNRIIMPSDYTVQADAAADPLKLETDSSPAARAGLKTGDRIVAVNGQATRNYREYSGLIVAAAKQRLTLTVDRGGHAMELSLSPVMDPNSGAGRIGVAAWTDPVVKQVRGVAAAAGLLPGDYIVSAAGKPVANTIDLRMAMRGGAERLPIQVARGDLTMDLTVVTGGTADGFFKDCDFAMPEWHTPSMGPLEAVSRGVQESFDNLALIIRSLGLLFQGLNPFKAINGPGRIVPMIGEVVSESFSVDIRTGLVNSFKFISLVSIALFFGNLLPIPALDGGQILLFIGEAISRRPLNPRFVQRYQIVGAVLVFALLFFAIFGDVLYWTGL